MKTFPFEFRKAMQAIGVLHAAECAAQVAYYRLLKLLYIAEREFLKETGRPIVGGANVAMEAGPLSSPIYDLIKGEHPDSPEWEKCFSRTGKRYLTMLANPGTDELSKREIKKLHEVAERLGDRDDEELRMIVHGFPEQERHFKVGTSTPIPLESVLEALGMETAKESILADAERVVATRQLFGG